MKLLRFYRLDNASYVMKLGAAFTVLQFYRIDNASYVVKLGAVFTVLQV